MSITAGLVVTTIYDPVVLEGYFQNFEQYGHLDNVDIYVIPDRKTPAQAYERCLDLSRRGLKVTCPTLAEQKVFLDRVDFYGAQPVKLTFVAVINSLISLKLSSMLFRPCRQAGS